MFGSSARIEIGRFLLCFLVAFIELSASAQTNDFKPTDAKTEEAKPTAAPAPSDPMRAYSRGRILNQAAIVYKLPDFDSPQLGRLAKGKIFYVFPKPTGAFYRIKVANVFGYIADNDIRILKQDEIDELEKPPPEKETKKEKPKKTVKKDDKPAVIKKHRPLAQQRVMGLVYEEIDFTENTMGAKRSSQRGFFGIKLSGPDVLVDGGSSELNLLYSQGAPSYYQTLTGNSADGFIFIADMQMLSTKQLNKFSAFYFGVGPFFRFSHFQLALNGSGINKTVGYNADDLNLGLMFSLGLGLQIGDLVIRPEFRYQWERTMYWGAGLAVQGEF